ncbi:YbhB/YbcL family Raf kinase inhibitor-like protein [Haladaptatus sp. F3-133]|uniref:YbhB/YbcL family Raf kinase inhibitor-like protein n=1 Tax=Halorutilus salinus TaxID=2487751 RepID=A0A9Q4GID9_9EURY|nr:YbhB/YbcL family Raf kinase inhibitor-like protein [Halorutilus salinus]MCX2818211.1 YbhB/YbcL family Raf kinase inhibitor-like protein [Halorutilus salinus]
MRTTKRSFVAFVAAEVGNIPGGVRPEPTVGALGGARQGTNDAGEMGYTAPCPPEGDGKHTYRFVVHAVEDELDLEPGAGRDELGAALDGSTVATAHLEATYER